MKFPKNTDGPDTEYGGIDPPLFQYKLENFNPGMVWLDPQWRIVALNDIALQVLGPTVRTAGETGPDSLIGRDLLSVHPPKSHDKIKFLMHAHEQGKAAPASHPPIAMMINIPDRMLVIKVSEMAGADGIMGTCMVFYDVTDETTVAARTTARDQIVAMRSPRLL